MVRGVRGRSRSRGGVLQVRTHRGAPNRLQPRTSAGHHQRGAQSREPSSKARLMLGSEVRWGGKAMLAISHAHLRALAA